MMIRCEMIAGYDGQYGTVTASKCFTVPFMPEKGMRFTVDNMGFEHTDDEPRFDVNQQTYTFHASDADDLNRHCAGVDCLNTIIETFTRLGWEVLDWFDKNDPQ